MRRTKTRPLALAEERFPLRDFDKTRGPDKDSATSIDKHNRVTFSPHEGRFLLLERLKKMLHETYLPIDLREA